MLRFLCPRFDSARVLLITLIAVAVSTPVRAGDLTWSGSSSAAWDTTSNNWNNGTSTVPWSNTDGDAAIFSSTGAGSHALSVPITAYSINFATTGFTITGSSTNTITLENTFGTGNTLAAGDISVVASGTATISAPIAGTIGLTKVTKGTLTLSGVSTYSGGTNINNNGGIIILGTNNALPFGTNLSIIDTAVTNTALVCGLNMGAFNQTIGTLSVKMPSATSATTAITSSGGVLTLGGNVTETGASGAFPSVIAAPVNLGGATRTIAPFNGGNTSLKGDLQFTGVISGTGGIVINSTSAGGVAFGAANTYTGSTTLTTGYLYGLLANFIPSTSAVSLASGTYIDTTEAGGVTTGFSTGIGSLTGAGYILTGTAGIMTIGADNTSPAAFSGYIGATTGTVGGGLTKVGTGTLILSGVNTYIGATTVAGGTLQLTPTSGAAINANSALIMAGGTLLASGTSATAQSFGSTTFNAGGSSITNSSATSGHTIKLAALTANVGGTVNFTPGTIGITTTQASVNGILGGYATYTTGTTATNWAVGATTQGTALAISAYAAYTAANTLSGNNIAFATPATNYAISASGTPTSISAANSLDFTNTTSNTTLTLTGGTLVITSGGILIPQSLTAGATDGITGGTIEGKSGGSLYIQQFNNSTSTTPSPFTISSVIANNTTATALTYSGASTSVTILSGANTYTGATYINGGTLNAGIAQSGSASGPFGTSGTIFFGNGTLQYSSNTGIAITDYSARFSQVTANQNFSVDTNGRAVTWATALISSGGSLTKLGTGSLTLTSATTNYSGSTTISGGSIVLSGSGVLPSGTNLSISEGALTTGTFTNGLNLGSTNQTIGTLTIAMTTATTGGTSTTAITGSGTLTLGGSVTTTGVANSYGVIIAAPISLGSTTQTFTAFGAGNSGSRGGDLQFTGVISGTGTAGVTINGSSTSSIVTFGAANTYPGPTMLTQGILYITTGGSLAANSAIPSNSSFVQSSGTTLDLTAGGSTPAGNSTFIGSLSGAGTIGLGTSAFLSIGGNGLSGTYTGSFTGGGGLILTGNGILTLGGASTSFTGTTTLNPGSTAGGGLTFSGSTGAAASAGNLTVGNGGSLVPTLTFDNTTANNNARYSASATVTLNNGAITLLPNATTSTAQSLGALTVSGTGTSTITVNSTGTGVTSSLTFASLTSIGASATLIFAGNNFGTSGDGVSSQIYFSTQPANNSSGYITNAYIGSVSSSNYATTTFINGLGYEVIQLPPPSGNLIDNIGTDPSASAVGVVTSSVPVATTATFKLTSNYPGISTARANTGAALGSLILDSASLTLFGVYGPVPITSTPNNNNTAITTLAVTSTITSQNLTTLTIYADPTTLPLSAGGGIVSLGSGGTITTTTNLTFDSTVSLSAGAFTKNGAGTLTLNGGFTTTDLVTVSVGTLALGGTGSAASLATSSGTTLALGTAGALTVTQSTSTAIAGTITGSTGASLTMAGSGTLSVSGSNTNFNGTLGANAGIISTTTDANLGGTSTVAFNGGTLQFGAGYTIASTQFVTVGTNGGTIDTGTFTTPTIAATISGSGTLTKISAGTLTISGTNTSFTGTLAVTNGILSASADNNLGSTSGSTLSISNGATFQFGSPFTIIAARTVTLGTGGGTIDPGTATTAAIAAPIGGAGGLTVINTGTLTLSGSLTYGGATAITGGGGITLGTNVALPSGTNLTIGTSGSGTDNILTIAGGALTIGSITAYNGSSALPVNIAGTGSMTITGNINQPTAGSSYCTIFGSGVPITLTSANPIITGAYNGNDSTSTYPNGDMNFQCSIAGTNGITFTTSLTTSTTDTPSIVLSGNNTFTGGVTIIGATLRINNPGALNSTTPNSVNMTATSTEMSVLRLQGNSITIGSLASSGTSANILVEGYSSTAANVVLTVNQATNTTFNGLLEDLTQSTGLLALTKTGIGTLALTGANTYTGGTAINGGILNAGIAQSGTTSGPFGASGTITFGGGTLQYSASNHFDYSARFSSSVTLEPYSVDTNNISTTVVWATALGSSGGSLTKAGGGTLSLTAASPNLTGGTTITGGILNIGISSALSASPSLIIGASSSSSSNTSGELTLGAGFTQTVSGLTIYQGSGTRVSLGATGTLTLNGAFNYLNIASGGGTLGNAAGTMTIASAGGTISLGTVVSTFTVNGQNNASSTPDVTISVVLTGTSAGGINYIGVPSTFASTVPAILKLSKANTYAGATTINEGILQMGIAGALPSATALTLANNISSGTAAQNAVLDLNGFNQTVTSLASGSGAVTAQNIVTNTSGTAATLTVSGATSTTYAGLITGSLGLTKGLSGTLTLGGLDTYTGATTLSGGSIFITVNSAIPSTSAFVQTTGTTLDLSAGGTLTSISTGVGSLTGTGSIVLGASSTLTVGGDNTSPAGYAGAISVFGGTGGALTKNGTGTLTLTGTNTYTGITTINAGILQSDSAGISGTSGLAFGGGTLKTNSGAGISTSAVVTTTTASDIVLDTTNGPIALSGNIYGDVTNTSGLQLVGGGTLSLSGTNTYYGNTTVKSGTLVLGSSNAAGMSSSTIALGTLAASSLLTSGAVTIANPITVGTPGSTIGGNTDNASSFTGAITLNGNLTVTQVATSGTNALSISGGITGGTGVYATVTLAGPGMIIVSSSITDGSGGSVSLMITSPNVTLAMANAFTGQTTVSSGSVLRIDGDNSASTGPIIVSMGGTLRGKGIIGGPVTVNTGGTIQAGDSPDTLTLNNGLTVSNRGTLGLEIAGGLSSSTLGGSTSFSPQTNNFYHVAGGATSIDPGALITVQIDSGTTFAPGSPYSYQIADGTSDLSGLNINNSGNQITFTGIPSIIDPTTATLTGDSSGDIYLNFSTMAAPEPAAVLGLAALVLGFPAFRRILRKA